MPVDIYSAIVGEPPTEQEKIAALAKKLRGQQMLGQLGALTGDKILAPMGQGISATTQAQTEKIGGLQARRRELEAQEAMRAASALERAREAELNRQHDFDVMAREQSFQAQQKAQDRALRKALDAQTETDYRKFSSKDIEKLSEKKEEIDSLDSIVSGFKPEYAGLGVPGGRAVSNYIASKGLGTEGMKDAQKWWMDWEKAYTLPTRNKMFGSALTAPERKAWNEANITKDMTPEQIQRNIATINELRQKAVDRMGNSFKVEGFNPETVDSLFGPSAEEQVMTGKGRPSAPTGGKKPSRTLDQISIEELQTLSDEELAALVGGG